MALCPLEISAGSSPYVEGVVISPHPLPPSLPTFGFPASLPAS